LIGMAKPAKPVKRTRCRFSRTMRVAVLEAPVTGTLLKIGAQGVQMSMVFKMLMFLSSFM
jgi:hypothetical protein